LYPFGGLQTAPPGPVNRLPIVQRLTKEGLFCASQCDCMTDEMSAMPKRFFVGFLKELSRVKRKFQSGPAFV
jgi:hypothetical protein